MSVQENKATVQRWFEEFWNAGNLDAADELLHPKCVFGEGYASGQASVAAYKEGNAFWHRVMPDIHFALDEVVGEGDTVVARWTARGTHQGEWDTTIGTLPASGKATMTSGTSTYHLQDGKIVRDFNHIDFLTTLGQLGAVVQAGEAGK